MIEFYPLDGHFFSRYSHEMQHPWRAVYCFSRSEIFVAAACTVLGLENYCPRYKLAFINRGHRREILIPFLSSYVFIRFDGTDPTSWNDVMGTKGTIRLLPGFVLDHEIDALRSQVGDGGELSYEVKSFFRKINPGNHVRLAGGPFIGQEGVVTEIDDKLSLGSIEIALLGRVLVVLQPLAWCEQSVSAADGGNDVIRSRSKRQRRRLRTGQRKVQILANG